MQDSLDSRDQSINSPMESAQECWSSDPTCHKALKQQNNEHTTEAQSDTKPSGSLKSDDASSKQSKLGSEAQSDTKPLGSLKSDDASSKQSKLGGEAQSDTKPLGSLKSDDASSKQSKLGGEAQSDTKPLGSLKSDNASSKQSKLGGEAQSDTKLSGSLESDDTSLKQSRVEAGEPTAKNKRRSVLDSMSKLVRKITPSKKKRKDEENLDARGSSVKSKQF